MRYPQPAFGTREPRHNLFFAIYPAGDTAEKLDRFTDCLLKTGLLSGPRVAANRLHISLNHLGEYSSLPVAFIDAVRDAVSKLKAPSFIVSLNRIMAFEKRSGPRPLVLTGDDGLAGIFMMHQIIHGMLAKAGLMHGAEARILPHLTLLRENDDYVWGEDFIEPVSWRVREFHLIHSPYGESRHEILGSWPLIDA